MLFAFAGFIVVLQCPLQTMSLRSISMPSARVLGIEDLGSILILPSSFAIQGFIRHNECAFYFF
jgi:hypothetical protein